MDIKENFNINLARISAIEEVQPKYNIPKGVSMAMVSKAEPQKIFNLKLLIVVLILFLFACIFDTIAGYLNINGNYSYIVGLGLSMILVFIQYLFLTKANQLGYEMFTIFQLGLIVEVMSWITFLGYVKFYRKEKIKPKMWLSLIIMTIAIYIGYS